MGTDTFFLPLAGLLFLPSLTLAQGPRDSGPETTLGVSFLVGTPREELADFIHTGYGGELTGRVRLEPTGRVSLRADLGFLIYGLGSVDVGCGDCEDPARLYTSNGIFFGGIGPELSVPLDWARPYLNAFVGFGYFSTSGTTGSSWWEEEPMTNEYMGDGAFSCGFGGGIEVSLRGGDAPIFLNLGARYHQHGVMSYLREGDIRDDPEEGLTLFPVVSEANLVSFRIGVTVGLPSPGPEDGSRD